VSSSFRFAFLTFALLLALPMAATAITQEEAQEAGEPAPEETVYEQGTFDHGVQEPEADDIPEPGTTPATGDDLLPANPAAPTSQQPAGDPQTATPVTPAPPEDKGSTDFNVAILQGLNKVTARAQELEAPIGSVTRFGTIEIVVHKCWKSAPSDRPENAALLEVSEIKQNETPQRIYSGWMFSSTPGISSLEHPFYDITVVECKKVEVKN